jgi:uncharacterized membrane-anchored protein
MIAPRPLCVLLALVMTVAAQESAPDEAQMPPALKQALADLKYQSGEIPLDGGLATLRLPENLRYLSGKDAETVLVKIWGNPPSEEKVLGMLLPAGKSPATAGTWGVIIQYEESGYVKDDDAAKINYTDLLKKMQDDARKANEAREKNGYPSIELVGWATPPRYDAQAKKLYWAKELKFGGDPDNTLNYNIRILGRRGVLVLNAVASISQLPEIEQTTPAILGAVDFQEGHRYVDFNPATDKVATYGLAALIAGGVLAKTGFFKVIIAAILAGKKFVIIGAAAIFAAVRKLFGRKNEA